MKAQQNKAGVLIILIVAGMILGSALWWVLSPLLPETLHKSLEIGSTAAPWSLDLGFAVLSFGIVLRLNLGSAFGLLVAILIFILR